MANRNIYRLTGRYLHGTKVVGYHAVKIDDAKSEKFSRDQVIFLTGRGQVENCRGQIYQDKVILQGVGCNLDKLPVRQVGDNVNREKDQSKNTNTLNKLGRQEFRIEKIITQGNNLKGFQLKHRSGQIVNMKTSQVIKLAKDGKLENANYTNTNGKPSLKGTEMDLSKLPKIQIS